MAVTRAAGAGNEDIIRPFHPIYLVSLFCRLEDISLEDARLLFDANFWGGASKATSVAAAVCLRGVRKNSPSVLGKVLLRGVAKQ
jgi:hypothetical protein